MHDECLPTHEHDHAFGQDVRRCGEGRTRIVIVLTALTMVAEIAAGIAFGSMALLADGIHMASHAVALGIAAFAYWYARRHARDPRYAFGTGKVNALGGYTGAVLLAGFAVMMAWESVHRLLEPVAIAFDAAIAVAVVGLLVNAVSAVLLGAGHAHDHGEAPPHGHEHAHTHDHNLKAAYFHVLADALTSLTAIVALLAGKFLGWGWMDPLMGIVGSLLVARWSWGLLRQSGHVLLDRQAPDAVRAAIQAGIEGDGPDRVVDLHVWEIGPGIRAAALTVVTDDPQPPAHYRDLLPASAYVMHATVEVTPCRHEGDAEAAAGSKR